MRLSVTLMRQRGTALRMAFSFKGIGVMRATQVCFSRLVSFKIGKERM